MQFTSLDFAIYLPLVFILYWFVVNKNLRQQNIFVLVASYVFYGWWDWRFLLLIFFSTVVDYLVGLGLAKEAVKRKRKILLWVSIIANIGLLAVFKYYGFFIDNFIAAFSVLGYQLHVGTLSIILPVGISFYTFQTLSYTIDIYRKRIQPTNNFISFAAYVSFFPQLVAGPIERAKNLLPQFLKKRVFDYHAAIDGLKQILWGLVKKMVIADNCANYANYIFDNSTHFSGSTLLLGGILFTFQIYGDFSGYSDIAIGTARLFGFSLTKNFSVPFFSRDIAEFWRRWHMSLTTWFRDYIYIPLGGSRSNVWVKVRNVFVVFIISSFWHGANWTFIVWGIINAIFFLPLLLANTNRSNMDVVAQDRLLPSIKELLSMMTTFVLVVLGFIIFRASSIAHAWQYFKDIFTQELLTIPSVLGEWRMQILLCCLVLFFVIEWIGRRGDYAIEKLLLERPKVIRYSFYYLLLMLVFFFGGPEQKFIYFQF